MSYCIFILNPEENFNRSEWNKDKRRWNFRLSHSPNAHKTFSIITLNYRPNNLINLANSFRAFSNAFKIFTHQIFFSFVFDCNFQSYFQNLQWVLISAEFMEACNQLLFKTIWWLWMREIKTAFPARKKLFDKKFFWRFSISSWKVQKNREKAFCLLRHFHYINDSQSRHNEEKVFSNRQFFVWQQQI